MARKSKGEGIPEAAVHRWCRLVHPLATYNEEGELLWTLQLAAKA